MVAPVGNRAGCKVEPARRLQFAITFSGQQPLRSELVSFLLKIPWLEKYTHALGLRRCFLGAHLSMFHLRFVPTIFAVLLIPSAVIHADERSFEQKAADAAATIKHGVKEAANATANAARSAWKSAKASTSNDPVEFRNGVTEKLNDCTQDVEQLDQDAKGVLAKRPYFTTRVRALHEQLAFVRNELSALPATETDFTAARDEINNTLNGLENAIDQAKEEVRASN